MSCVLTTVAVVLLRMLYTSRRARCDGDGATYERGADILCCMLVCWISLFSVLFVLLRDVGLQNRFCHFGLVSAQFKKNWDSVRNGFCLVRFKKTQFSSDIIVIYYSCNSWEVNLQQILQQQWVTWLWRHCCYWQQWQQVNNVIAF